MPCHEYILCTVINTERLLSSVVRGLCAPLQKSTSRYEERAQVQITEVLGSPQGSGYKAEMNSKLGEFGFLCRCECLASLSTCSSMAFTPHPAPTAVCTGKLPRKCLSTVKLFSLCPESQNASFPIKGPRCLTGVTDVGG